MEIGEEFTDVYEDKSAAYMAEFGVRKHHLSKGYATGILMSRVCSKTFRYTSPGPLCFLGISLSG